MVIESAVWASWLNIRGWGAFQYNTTGVNNTATGGGALNSNIGGFNNTASGSW
jgi:hypothetical protein